jgi:cell division septation protein DedD
MKMKTSVESAVRCGLLAGLTAFSLSLPSAMVCAADAPPADAKAKVAVEAPKAADAKAKPAAAPKAADAKAKPAAAPKAAAVKKDEKAAPAATKTVAHPDSSKWEGLFKADLSDAVKDEGVWTVDNKDGAFTASQDSAIWGAKDYEDFVLDLEFKTENGTNSGVIVHCTDMKMWIPNSVEIQIADDFSKEWSEKPATWHCGAIFGRLAPTESAVKKPGEWNRMTVTCKGKMITVVINGKQVTEMDMAKWTDPKKNPDGSDIPEWLNKPAATLPLKGKIGLQGKHADASIFFRNVKIQELKAEAKPEVKPAAAAAKPATKPAAVAPAAKPAAPAAAAKPAAPAVAKPAAVPAAAPAAAPAAKPEEKK